MKRMGIVAVLSLLACGCGLDPDPDLDPAPVERSELEQAAEALLQLHNGQEIFAGRFSKRPTSLVERMEWFREAIGPCDRYELQRSFGPKRARFVYHCERGQLEASIRVGAGDRVTKLVTGARGVNPPAKVRAAAERWLASPEATADAEDCRIDRVHLGSPTGALFVLVCPDGEKTLIYDAKDADGAPRRVGVIDRALDEWRVPVNAG